MAVAERTYTFRAAASLGERMRGASAVLEEVRSGENPEATEHLARELVLLLLRRSDDARNLNQSAFTRLSVELLLEAAEKLAMDADFTERYTADRATDDEIASRQAATRAVARRWRDL